MASRLALPEVSATLSAAGRAGRLDATSERRARRVWATYWPVVGIIELTGSVSADAAHLAEHLVIGGADAVHLASARTLESDDAVLVSWDRRLSAAARSAGVSVAPNVI